ncbi:MAG: DMT family transporter, partial [bacterium]|nr:DMT family transporter [bacterium]
MQEDNSNHTELSDRPQISRGKALGLLFLGAVGISFSPTLVKAVGQNVVGPTAIAFWRTLIGGIALLVLTLLQGKRLTVSRRTFLWCTFTGFVFFLDLTFWHRSILYVGSGMATMLGNTQVFSTAVLSVFIFK